MKATLLAIATSRSGSIVFMKKVEKTSVDAIQPAITSHMPHLRQPIVVLAEDAERDCGPETRAHRSPLPWTSGLGGKSGTFGSWLELCRPAHSAPTDTTLTSP